MPEVFNESWNDGIKHDVRRAKRHDDVCNVIRQFVQVSIRPFARELTDFLRADGRGSVVLD